MLDFICIVCKWLVKLYRGSAMPIPDREIEIVNGIINNEWSIVSVAYNVYNIPRIDKRAESENPLAWVYDCIRSTV